MGSSPLGCDSDSVMNGEDRGGQALVINLLLCPNNAGVRTGLGGISYFTIYTSIFAQSVWVFTLPSIAVF